MQSQSQHIGACAIIFNKDEQVLLGKRKNAYKSGYYGLPGGRVELHEPVELAIKREVLEETGMQLADLRYLGVVRENQGGYDFIHFIFIAKNVDQQPALCEPEKCEGWEWINMENLSGEILPGHQAAINMYHSKKTLMDI